MHSFTTLQRSYFHLVRPVCTNVSSKYAPLHLCFTRSISSAPLTTLKTPLTPITATTRNYNNDNHTQLRIKVNPALQSIKYAGLKDLEQITQESISRGKQSLLSSSSSSTSNPYNNNHNNQEGPSIRQLKKAKQIHRMLNEELNRLSGTELTFCIAGESIELTQVEISPDLRHARVYWTLPYALMDTSEQVVRSATAYMQHQLDAHGIKLKMALSRKLRQSRNVPKLRFVAENTLLTHTDVIVRNTPQLF